MDFSANLNAFTNGLSTFLIGIVVVFVTLLLLILFITLMGKLVARIEYKEKIAEDKIEEQSEEEGIHPVASQQKDELELIAVITAVLAASMGTTTDKLQVKSFRKVERQTR